MVTEYAPGAGIGWHLDRPSYEDIVAVSFLAPCVLRLRRKMGDGWERRSAHIEPRSVYLLHGSVRTVWQHSIAPMDVLRYSVTLRTFRPGRECIGRLNPLAPRYSASSSSRPIDREAQRRPGARGFAYGRERE
jgi:hypothetical protein